METLKNFLTGLIITVIALTVIGLGILLWPLIVGIGSLVLFVAIVVVGVILVFYIIVLIGYVVRKGLSSEKKK